MQKIPIAYVIDRSFTERDFNRYGVSELAKKFNFYIVDLSGYVSIYLNCEEANFDDGDCDPIPGCTDPEACNYNSNNATVEDGSCIYEGCTCEDYNLSLNVLKKSDVILCEDTRRSGKLLSYFKIKNKLLPYHKFNETKISTWTKNNLFKS